MPAENVFDVVIFDYDGTLSDTRSTIAHCLQRALGVHGRAIPPSEHIAQIVGEGLSLRETFLHLDRGLTERPADLETIVETYRRLYRSEGEPLIKMFSGVEEVLRLLHSRSVKCLIVSNKGTQAIHRSLERNDLSRFIDMVFAEQPGIPNKADPKLLTDHVFPRHPDVKRQRMLMVGDTEVDIWFARQAGIACCWAAYGFGDARRCVALAPEHQIASIENLPAIIWPPAACR